MNRCLLLMRSRNRRHAPRQARVATPGAGLLSVLLFGACSSFSVPENLNSPPSPSERSSVRVSQSPDRPTGDTMWIEQTPQGLVMEGKPDRALGWVEIPVVYHNRRQRAVYLGQCPGHPLQFVVDKLVDGKWVRAYRPLCQRVLMPPDSIPAGVIDTLSITIWYSRVPTHHTDFRLEELAGWYRLVLDLYADMTYGPENAHISGLLPLEQRISPSFCITDPSRERAVSAPGCDAAPPDPLSTPSGSASGSE
ncbi:hypothetical protein BH23GEM4_BH23GEM4_21040 [soil metagenome]